MGDHDAVPHATIAWPTRAKAREWAARIAARWPGVLPRRPFGFIDGLRLSIHNLADEVAQSSYYNDKECETCIGNVLCYGADGTVFWWKGNCPGSWHDMDVGAPLWPIIKTLPTPYCILADQGFHRSDLARCLQWTRGPNDLVRSDVTDKELITLDIAGALQAAELGMRSVQGTLARLGTVLTANHTLRGTMLEVGVHLHNFIVRTVGVEQTSLT